MQFLKKFSKLFFKISLLAALCLPTLVLPSGLVFAQDATCTCYCGDTTSGAQAVGTKQSISDCTSACNDQRKLVVGCYPVGAGTPENDGKCWTQDECAHYATDHDGNVTPGVWGGGQSANCVESKTGASTGYCYSPSISVDLNVPILGHTSVMGFNEYLALAYTFLLPAMSLIAVVMVMVGGLEYVVAGGNSKRVDKAKHRITNALVGLVLLMSAYAIASLLDPRLVNLQALRTPLIKQVEFVDPNSTCEYLASKHFDIDKDSGACGDTGHIEGIDNVDADVKNSNWKVGDECKFSSCALGSVCSTGADGKGQCVTCADINTIAADVAVTGAVTHSALTPSDYVCSNVAQQANDLDKTLMTVNDVQVKAHKYYCSFESEGINSCESAGVSAEAPYIDCNTVRSDALSAPDNPCSAYDTVNIIHRQLSTQGEVTPLTGVYSGDFSFAAKICEDDPCGVARDLQETCSLYVATTSGEVAYGIAVAASGGLASYFTSIDNHCATNHSNP